MTLFLSHSSEDKALVREIKGNLHEFLNIWLDERQLIPGESLANTLKGAVSESDLVLIFISKASIESKWVNKEIDWAINKELELNRPFLMPIVLDGSKPPSSLASRLYFNLSSQSKNDVTALSNELNEKLFQYAVKYGVKKTVSSALNEDNSNDSDGMNKVIDFTLKLVKSAESDIQEKFSLLIENNIELKPKTILLLCKNEVDEDLIDIENQENNRDIQTKESEKKDTSEKGLAGSLYALKGMSNDSKIKTYKAIQRKINFILNNATLISDEEGVYMLKKYLAIKES
jgi:hypothetical protein